MVLSLKDPVIDHPIKHVLVEKLNLLGYQLWFITGDLVLKFPPADHNQQIPPATLAYLRLVARLSAVYFKKYSLPAWLVRACLKPAGKRTQMINNPDIWELRYSTNVKTLFIVNQDYEHIPWSNINQLVNTAVVTSGHLPLHASAVEINGKLLLFSGPSGSGKSTIAGMCTRFGACILDEDQVLIRENSDGSFSADAWGYRLEKSTARICAVFQLIQSDENYLVSMPAAQTARFILEQVIALCGSNHSNMKTIFSDTARLARSVPGYQLHFNKTMKFWGLIEKELNLERQTHDST